MAKGLKGVFGIGVLGLWEDIIFFAAWLNLHVLTIYRTFLMIIWDREAGERVTCLVNRQELMEIVQSLQMACFNGIFLIVKKICQYFVLSYSVLLLREMYTPLPIPPIFWVHYSLPTPSHRMPLSQTQTTRADLYCNAFSLFGNQNSRSY